MKQILKVRTDIKGWDRTLINRNDGTDIKGKDRTYIEG